MRGSTLYGAEPRWIKPLILVIDDSQTIRKLVECHLSQAGYRVAMAANAEQGLELARTLQPQLILLDHQLPGTTGDEVCRQLLEDEVTARIPVVVSSAMRNRAYAKYTEYPNVVDQIPKPFTPELLKSGVANALQIGCDGPAGAAHRLRHARGGRRGPRRSAGGNDRVVPTALGTRFPEQSPADRPAHPGSGPGPAAVRIERRPGAGGVLADDGPGPAGWPTPGRAVRPRSVAGVDARRATGPLDGRARQDAGTQPVRPQAAPNPAEVPGGHFDLRGNDGRAGQVCLRASDESAADVPGLPVAAQRSGLARRGLAMLQPRVRCP